MSVAGITCASLPKILGRLHMDSSWYTLFIPKPQMLFTDFGSQTAMWHDILVTLLKGYVEKVYNNAKSRWMSQNVETAIP